jgi:hypothetical protein
MFAFLRNKSKHFFRKINLILLKKTSIKVIYDEDLIGVLETLGLVDEKSFCVFCRGQVTEKNLFAFKKTPSGVELICSSADCSNNL